MSYSAKNHSFFSDAIPFWRIEGLISPSSSLPPLDPCGCLHPPSGSNKIQLQFCWSQRVTDYFLEVVLEVLLRFLKTLSDYFIQSSANFFVSLLANSIAVFLGTKTENQWANLPKLLLWYHL